MQRQSIRSRNKLVTEDVPGNELKVGDAIILLVTDTNVIDHFDDYTGPLDFVERIMRFTNGRSCSVSKESCYKRLVRIENILEG